MKPISLRCYLFFVVCVAASLSGQLAMAATLYVTESTGIYKFTENGVKSTYTTDIFNPVGLAFDNNGSLFVSSGASSLGTGNIYKYDINNNRSTFATGLSHPFGLAFDANGNLFEADKVGQKVFKFTPDGSRSTFASSGITGPSDIAFDANGNVYETNFNNDLIYKFNPDGVQTQFGDATFPVGLAFDTSGNLFVSSGPSIYKFSSSDGSRTVFGNLGSLSKAFGMAFDSSGNLFVADNGNGNIFKFTPDGTKTTFATGLHSPAFIAFAPVPEPSIFFVSCFGIVGLLMIAKRHQTTK